jgi:uncharacterized short protein YbdD (DUF466 family)
MTELRRALRSLWEFVRDASGENDYARYQASVLGRAKPPLTPRDFYAEKLERKYSRPNRCC